MIIVSFVTWLLSWLNSSEPQKIQFTGYAQGTTWAVTYYAHDTLVTKLAIEHTLLQLDSALSIYKPFSLISQFNASRKGIMADAHLYNVVNRSLQVWKDGEGSFDITVQPLVKAWGFGNAQVKKMPTSSKIKKLLKHTGSEHITINTENNYIGKRVKKLTLDVNGIAQGYSVDVVANLLEAHGLPVYIVEIGGEIRTKGRKPDNTKMKIGIEAPGDYSMGEPLMQKTIEIENGAITTSGNYRRFIESNGKRISHHINPKTGMPFQNNLISVTVFAEDAMTADAYDNVLIALGMEKALAYTEERRWLAAYFIYRTPDGQIKDTASSRFLPLLRQ